MIAASVLALPVLLLYPDQAAIALGRLAKPFGGLTWPPETRLEITARDRIARGDVFDVHGRFDGRRPRTGHGHLLVRRFSAGRAGDRRHRDKETETGPLHARLEPGRAQRNFRFQVRANDAVSGWYEVSVLPPPLLVPLDGRPSPQLRPATSPPIPTCKRCNCRDGTGQVETVAGTRVALRAATDRPISRAWIEFPHRPEQPHGLAAFLAPLAARQTGEALVASVAGRVVWDKQPVAIEAHPASGGSLLTARFVPWVSGAYVLHFEDEIGVAADRLLDIRAFPDPPPIVNLERPSASQDSLAVLPTAAVTVQVSAEDPQFALRSAYLEFRCKKDDPPRRLPLYHHEKTGAAVGHVLSGLARLPAPPPPPRLRPAPCRWSSDLPSTGSSTSTAAPPKKATSSPCKPAPTISTTWP